MPLFAVMLKLKTRVDSVLWPNEHYVGGEEMISKDFYWRGFIFEVS